jgi:NhaP-type Na+/H+ or K+/H+ antiporter
VGIPGDAWYLLGGLALLLGAVLPGVVSQRALSVPMAFVGIGALLGLLPIADGLPLSPIEHPEAAERLAELTVIVALMGVGLALDRPLGLRSWAATWRLLLVGMPLFIGLVAVLGWWVLGLAPAAALLLGAVLAPTDPVLAADVQVQGPGRRDRAVDSGDARDEVDQQDDTRFSLTSEAGLNDALAFPFVYGALFLMVGEHSAWRWLGWELLGKTAIGAAIGWGCGYLLAKMAFRARSRALRLAHTGEPLLALAATFVAFGVAEVAGGYGFLAVFIAAVAIRAEERHSSYHKVLHEFVSQLEHLLTLLVLLLFGAALSGGLLTELSWRGVLVGVVAVVVLRPLTAGLSLRRRLPLGDSRLGPRERRVVAFFGIRGAGTLYYLAYATGYTQVIGIGELWATVGFTILLSVVVHGVLATPVMGWLDRRRSDPVAS